VKELTTTEIAERFGVEPRVARRWCEEKRFPNAHQLPVVVGRGKPWLVPESDFDNFVPPKPGRKLSGSPSPYALAKRRYREKATK
jgi:hypothetical protein